MVDNSLDLSCVPYKLKQKRFLKKPWQLIWFGLEEGTQLVFEVWKHT